jgi:DNA-binding MarR family transcriptional regulator
MNESDVKSATTFPVDEDGRLYNPEVRRLLADDLPPEAVAAIEASAALGYAVKLMHLGMERWAEQVGLSQQRLAVLFMLRHNPDGLPLGALATRMHVSPRNVTGLIDNLERDGLVSRFPDPADRRSVLARLTDRGRELIESTWKENMARQCGLLEGFAPEELAQLRHLCLRVVQKLQRAKELVPEVAST